MGALLPIEERYANLKYRRVARKFKAHRLDYADAAELCAFVDSIGGVKYAHWIFQWNIAAAHEAQELLKHLSQFEDHAHRVAENVANPTRDDGLKCLRAMQDGGWRQGSVPPVVRMAFLDMRDEGLSVAKVGRQVGMTKDQVQTIVTGARWRRQGKAVPVSAWIASSFEGQS